MTIATLDDDFEANDAQSPIEIEGLDPQVSELGVMVGLLREKSGAPGTYELNPTWFEDPIGKTGNALQTNGQAIGILLTSLLGSIGGKALGIPVKDPGNLGTWYPIQNPGTGKPTGLYILSQSKGDKTVLGVGSNVTWKLAGDVELRVWGVMPLVALSASGVVLAAGSDAYPLDVGIEVASKTPMLNRYGFSFNGVKASGSLALFPEPAVKLSVVVLQLKLPTDEKATDRSLADIEQLTGEQILSAVSSLFLGALSEAVPEGVNARIGFLLPLLGLSPRIPSDGFEDVRLPLLRWDQIITYAKTDPAQPFKEWFNTLLSTPDLLEGWLASLQGVLGIQPLITGTGTRDDPYRVEILSVEGIGSVAFTIATTVDDQARRTLYPGLDFVAKKIVIGTSSAAIRMDARLELAQFTIAGTKVSADPTSLRFNAGICMVGKGTTGEKDDPLFEGTVGGGKYVFGALCAGLTLGNATGQLQVIPRFELVNVVTPNGNYASLNLTQPGDVVDKALQELYTLIDNMLKALFGLAGGDTTPGYSIGALLGIVPPATGDPNIKWPPELAPPLSATQIVKSIQNPPAAIAAYWDKLLSDEIQVGGKTPFFYMVRQAALLFQEATSSGPVKVDGNGKPDDPWRAALNATESLSISLLSWFEPLPDTVTRTAVRMLALRGESAPRRRRLVLAFELTPKLKIGGTLDVDLRFKIDLLGLDLTAGAAQPAGVQVLPGLGLVLALPNGFTSPAVAGAAIKVASSGISVRWSPYDGWQWSMRAGAPALIVDGAEYPVGEDMVFTQTDSLERLVRDQATKFGRILTGILGIAVYRTGTRAGLALNGIVGLLPKLKMPAGIDWPADMPYLQLTSFNDPLGALRAQIAGVIATPARAKATLQLLSWAATSGDPKPLPGSGTLADPYQVSLGLASNIGLAVWVDDVARTAGIGIDHVSKRALPAGLEAETRLTVRLLNGSLLEGKLKPIEGEVPGAVLTTNIRRPNGKLIPPTAGTSLGSITLGVRVAVAGDIVAPIVTVKPLVLLNDLELPGRPPIKSINVADPAGSTELAQLLEQTLNLAIQKVLEAATDETLAKVYSLLAKMGLTLDTATSAIAGINPAGWTALLADPLPFLRDRLMALATDAASRRDIIQLLLQATGITLPTIPAPVKEILAALDLLDEVGLPNPAAFVELFSHPVQFLTKRFQALLDDRELLTQLLSALQQIVEPIPFGPFQLQILAGPVVSIGIAPNKTVQVGTILRVNGEVTLNFGAGTERLGLDLRLFNPQTKLAIVPSLRVPFSGGNVTFTLETQWGDGSAPAPPPIRFYPFNATAFVDQLAKVAPFYALSIAVGQVVDPLLLQKYKLVEVIFRALGIAEESGGKYVTKSLLGLFDDPAAWLLNGAVVGLNGQLNIAKLQTLLGEVPEVTSTLGVGTKKITNGFRIDGLPYNFAVDFTADAGTQRFRVAPLLAKPMEVASGAAKVEILRFGVALGPDFQPGFEGSAGVSVPALSGGLKAEAGFINGLYLRVSGGGAKPPVLQLVPFPGWQTLVQGAGQVLVSELLPKVTDKLLEGLASSGAKEFADALRKAGGELAVNALLQALVAAAGDAKKLEEAALGWLGDRMKKANADKTADAIVALLNLVTIEIKRDKALLSYKPSDKLPITLLAGATELGGKYQLGGWVAVSLPTIAIVRAGVEQTGVGVEFNPDTGIPTGGPIFNFGVVIDTPIPGEDRAPRLDIRFDNASKAFVAGLDPLGRSGMRSDLYRELLPKFFRDKPDVGAWIVAVLKDAAPRYLSIVLLNQKTVRGWLDSPIFGTVKPGKVLETAELLEIKSEKYVLRTVDQLAALTPQRFVGGLLEGLFSAEITVVTFDKDRGSIVVGPSKAGAGDVGMRVTARDLALAIAPNFVFQLGAKDNKWINDDNLKPGFGVFVPLAERLPKFDKTKMQVVNVGVDFVGKQQKPLIELSRFNLGKIKPRGLITFDFAIPGAVDKWGGAITLEQMAISLAPNTMSTTGKQNAVAQNLLGSGAHAKQPKPNPPSNPGFNARVSYLKGAQYPSVVFFTDETEGDTDIWVPVQRNFGPLAVNMIGLGWRQENTHLRVLFDGNVTLVGLYVGVEKLAVGFNAKAPTDVEQYSFDLAGLDVSFKGGPVELAGDFFKQDSPLRYDGSALLRAATFSLAALGSYGVIPIDPNDPTKTAASLFVFVNLNTPLGGPPQFFVMGLAAGFGYNRSLRIPGPGDIGQFPLVAGSINKGYFEKGPDGKADPTKALTKLGDYVPPVVGVFWVGAGLKGSTFQFLDVFALLFLTFGREFAVDLVGVISAGLPPRSPKTIAYFELAMIASFRPSEGLLSLRAQLTPNSYILAPQCRLTGGFALMWWFTGPNAGQFVITLGGYHPAYNKPKLYPDVPRIGFTWLVDVSVGKLVIEGGVYFALTPDAIMAGGELNASFEMGPLRAWLSAGANFMIQFQPFYYEISIWISIGISFRMDLGVVKITLTASLSASLELWGPPTAGKAEVTWYVISFTVPIGEQDRSLDTKPLGTWSEFEKNFLPPPPAPVGLRALDEPPPQSILKATAEVGMLQENGPEGWVIRATAWSLVQNTLIPATTMTVVESGQTLPPGPGMGVRPMEVSKIETPLDIVIEGRDGQTGEWKPVNLAARKIVVAPVTSAAPSALWSKDALNLDQPPDPAKSVLPNANGAVLITGIEAIENDRIGPIPMEKAFAFEPGKPRDYPPWTAFTPPDALQQDKPIARIMATIMSATVITTRDAVLKALREHNVAAMISPNLSVIAANADNIYTAPPTLAQLGGQVPARPIGALAPSQPRADEAPAAPRFARAAVSLLGGVRRYRAASGVQGRWIDRESHDARALDAFGRAQNDKAQDVRMFDGSVAVCAIEGRASLQVGGALAVRVIAFNEHDEIISDVEAAAGETVALPEQTAKAALQGGSCPDDVVAGWRSHTMLVRAARYTFLGDGCTVRPQATPLRRPRGRHLSRGMFEAAAMLAANRVSADGGTRSGWVETLLPSSVRNVVVALKGSAAHIDAARVKIVRTEDPWDPRYTDPVAPADIDIDAMQLHFDAPAGEGRVAVLVRIEDDNALTLDGVWGFANVTGAALHVSGVPLGAGAPAASTVTLTIEEEAHA